MPAPSLDRSGQVVAALGELRGRDAHLDKLIDSAETYTRLSVNPSTRRAYEQRFARFRTFVDDISKSDPDARILNSWPATPESVALWLAVEADRGLTASTLGGLRAAIRAFHVACELPDPTNTPLVSHLMRGIQRVHGRPAKGADALSRDELRLVIQAAASPTVKDLQGRAARLLLNHPSALSGGALARLRVGDVTCGDVVQLQIRDGRSSTPTRAALDFSPEQIASVLAALRHALPADESFLGYTGRRLNQMRREGPGAGPSKRSLELVRDPAVLLLAYGGALRRSEVSALRWGDLRPTPSGYRLVVARSKSDQEGHGKTKTIYESDTPELCPVTQVLRWRDSLQAFGRDVVADDAPIFVSISGSNPPHPGAALSGEAINKMFQRAVAQAEVNVAGRKLSSHSLRVTAATILVSGGVPEAITQRHLGHSQVTTTRGYVRPEESSTALGQVLSLRETT